MARRSALPPAPPDSPDEIEQHFYEAMQQGDIDKMMSLWADDDEISCVHPGGGRVMGAAAVRASFEAVFAHGSVDVTPEATRRSDNQSWAVHHVVERVRGLTPEGPRDAFVVATNVYVRTIKGWRLLVHHASPGSEAEIAGLGEAGAMLH